MKKLPLTLFAFLAAFTLVYSQEFGFLPGYVVVTKKDTLHGLIKYANYAPYRMLDAIKFKPNEDAKAKSYPPETTVGFQANGVTFHAFKLPDTGYFHFLELVIDGPVRLYRSKLTMMGVPQYGSADVENDYLLKSGASELVPIKGKFKKRMTEFFADAPTIVGKINTEEYKKRDIEEIVREYNQSKGK